MKGAETKISKELYNTDTMIDSFLMNSTTNKVI